MTLRTFPFPTINGTKFVCKVSNYPITTFGKTRSEATLKALIEIELFNLTKELT